MSRPQIANTIPFVNFFITKVYLHLDVLNWCRMLGYLEMRVLRFSVQREDILERTNDKCHVFTFSFVRERCS